MGLRTRSRRSTLAIVGVLALLATVLAAMPAAASGHEPDCGENVRIMRNRAYVSPSGADDTAAVQCAIDWAADYDGRGKPVIHLAAGTFHVDWIANGGFSGTIRGAGQAATVIEPLEGGLDCGLRLEQLGVTVWFAFGNADVSMRHLSFNIPTVACSEPYVDFVEVDPETGDEFRVVLQDFTFMVAVSSRAPFPTDVCDFVQRGSVKVDHVSVYAPTPNFGDPTSFVAQGAEFFVRAGGVNSPGCDDFDEMVGNVVVRNSHFEGIGRVIAVEAMADSNVHLRHNTTVEVEAPFVIVNNDNTKVSIKHNKLDTVFGPGVVIDNCSFPPFAEAPVCLEEPMRVNVSHNKMDHVGFAGVLVFDGFFGPQMVQAMIADNHVSLHEALATVLIGDGHANRVMRNHSEGSAVFGYLIEGESHHNRITRNDMRKLTTFEGAALFDPFTSNNYFVGNIGGGEVIDLGTDNVINHRSGPPSRVTAANQLSLVGQLEGLTQATLESAAAPSLGWAVDRGSYSTYVSGSR